MASNFAKSNKMMRRLESKKSHSWWWDSHVNPKNSKWLQENLDEMDQHVKRMLKLIEEDADSFAKKVEMYYQKRPELISLVENFYRMYRSLAEKYDNVTGELRKSIPSDLQSQGSGISDDIPSDQKLTRRKSGPRAAGFEFFLGNGGSTSDLHSKEGDESSTLDSESESEDSSVNNYSGTQSTDGEQGLGRKILDLEVELREVKEKLRVQQQGEVYESSYHKTHDENSEICAKIATYEEELRVSREKIALSDQEITRLKFELQKYQSSTVSDNLVSDDTEKENETMIFQESIDASESEISDPERKFRTLVEELRIAKEKIVKSEEEVTSLKQELTSKGVSNQTLQDQLKSAAKEISAWKNKFEKEKREVSKLHDRISRYKNNLSDRDQEIRGLKEAMSNANKSLSEENEQLQADVTRMLKEQTYLEDNLKELDLRCQFLEEDLRRVKAEKSQMETTFEAQIEQLNGQLDELNKNLDGLVAEKENLNAKIEAKDNQIVEMNQHLQELHMEHVKLIAGAEVARKKEKELFSKNEELEIEVKRQHEAILEGAEEKREAIRQLCFSLEHYRNGYHQLREAVIGHKRVRVMAS